MKVTKPILLLLNFLLCGVISLCEAQGQSGAVGIVVLDPGHGGKDPGTNHGGYKEKDINLAVALRLGGIIKANYPEVTVLYTRETDIFVPLYERTDIANKAKADLFISIHVDASDKSASANGVSTYVMGVDRSSQNLDVAMRENDVITYESDYSANYQGFEPGSSESYILFSLKQYSHQEQSLTLAAMVQKQYASLTGLTNRGVKQAGYLVLWNAAMPSILTEMGFMTNQNDRQFLGSSAGQEKLARSLFNAFSEYKVKCEGSGRMIVLDNTTAVSAHNTSPSAATQATGASNSTSGNVVYRIQVLSSSAKVAGNSTKFGVYRGAVKEIVVGNLYKYYVGEVTSYQEALSLQFDVRKTISDAFMVPFADDVPISIEEACRREQK